MVQRCRAEVLCVGAVTADVIALVDELPGDDQRVEDSDIVIAGGGPAATAALTLARLGVSVAFAGVVGDDVLADVALAGLKEAGVDLSLVVRDPSRCTARSIVLIERKTAGRRIITSQRSHVPELNDLPRTPWVHVDQLGYQALRQHGDRWCKSKLSVDGGNPIASLDLADVDVFAPTLSRLVSDDPGDPPDVLVRALARGAGVVVATDGAHGAWVAANDIAGGAPQQIPGFSVAVVSSLGAGDVFHGALLARLVGGAPPCEATRFANAAAALSCLALDGQSGVPDRLAIEGLLSRDGAR